MYPAQFFGLFPPFPREETVFVAMSFDSLQRFESVISPAIHESGLEPRIVNARLISDSIITDILKGICESRLVFADVSSDSSGRRNGNVMYEVGIAHAARQPQEVLLFRSDSDPLLFDLANIRVNHYDPDGSPVEAKETLKLAISSALKEVDLTKSMAVNRAVMSLSYDSTSLLWEVGVKGEVRPFEPKTMADYMRYSRHSDSVSRLLEQGLIEVKHPSFPVDVLEKAVRGEGDHSTLPVYVITPLGQAAIHEIGRKLGLLGLFEDPEALDRVKPILEKWAKEQKSGGKTGE